MLLIGDKVTAAEAHDRYGFVNKVIDVSSSATPEEGGAAVVKAALEMAAKIAGNSPDAVTVTKLALLAARDAVSPAAGVDESAIGAYYSERSRALYVGENLKEGLQAFAEVSCGAWLRHSFVSSVAFGWEEEMLRSTSFGRNSQPSHGHCCAQSDLTESTQYSLPSFSLTKLTPPCLHHTEAPHGLEESSSLQEQQALKLRSVFEVSPSQECMDCFFVCSVYLRVKVRCL